MMQPNCMPARVLFLIPLFVLSPPPAQGGQAATARDVLQRISAQAARLAPFEVVFDATDYSGLEPIRAQGRMVVSAPDRCRVERNPDPNSQTGQIMICSGATTLVRQPKSGRVQRYNRNLFTDWATGFAGPGNFAGFGVATEKITLEYAPVAAPGEPFEGHPTVVLILTDSQPRERLVKDYVDAGGSDIHIAYLAYKRKVYLRPPRIRLTFDTDRWLLVKREQYDSLDANARVSRTDTLVAAREVMRDVWFPERYETRNTDGTVIATHSYLNISPATNKDASMFSLALEENEVPEDAELQSIDVYRKETTADNKSASLLNTALYLIRWQEDPEKALAQLTSAEEAAQKSVAPRVSKAQVYAGLARYRDALASWSQVATLKPDYPNLYATLARLQLADKDRKSAKASFEQQIEKEPNDWLSRLALGEMMMQDAEYARARELFQRVFAPSTPSVLGRLQGADDLIVLARWSDEEELRSIASMSESEDDPVALKLKADALLLMNEPQKALAAIARIPSQPETRAVQFSAARSLERAGLLQEAQTIYEKLSTLGVNTAIGVNALQRLIVLRAIGGQIDPAYAVLRTLVDDAPSPAMQRDRRAFFIQAFQKALRLEELVRALEPKASASPPDELACRLLIDAYPLVGEGKKATDLVLSGPQKFPNRAWWYSRLASFLVSDARTRYPRDFGRPERLALLRGAKEAADKAISLEPNLYYEAQRVFIYDAAVEDVPNRATAKAQAQAAARAILRKYPNDPDALLVSAVLERTQNLSDSFAPIRLYQQALDTGIPLEDRHEELYFLRQSLANSYVKTSNYREAYRQYETLFDTARSPREQLEMASAILLTAGIQKLQSAAANQVAGLLYRMVKRKDTKANREAVLSEVFDSVTRNPDLRAGVESALATALQQQPKDPYVHLLLGRVLLVDRKLEEATTHHEQAAESSEQDPDLDAWLAEVWILNKGFIGAAERLERAIARDPNRPIDFLTLANVYSQLKRLNDILPLPQHLLLKVQNNSFAFSAAGELELRHNGHFGRAVAFYREAYRLALLDPSLGGEDTVGILVNLARAEARNGQFADAEKRFMQLTKTELGRDNRVAAWYALAETYFDAKRFNDTVAALKQALALSPPEEVKKEIEEKVKKVEELIRSNQ